MGTHYDIYNPTKARRVIWNGIDNKQKIVIDPGQIAEDVELADHVVKSIRDTAAKAGADKELELREDAPPPMLSLKAKDKQASA